VAPQGFFCRGAESAWTGELLAERSYVYTSNGFDDDLPYRDPSGLIVVPYALDANGKKFFHPNGIIRAEDLVEYFADALDVLHMEPSRWYGVGCHGAGDAFGGAYAAARLMGHNPPEAARRGIAASAVVIQSEGADAALCADPVEALEICGRIRSASGA
jgi:hypothetical protein